MAERAGMRYINVPMNVRGYPPADLAPRFLALVNDPENWPVYVHCHGGRHRTGVMTAVYRMSIEGWNVQRAYAEMRQYGFYKRWGHGPLKAYVFDYYRQLQQGADQSHRLDLIPARKAELAGGFDRVSKSEIAVEQHQYACRDDDAVCRQNPDE